MRGSWYTLEAIMAGIIVIGFLSVLGTSVLIRENTQVYQTLTYEILSDLYDKGQLRAYAYADDYDGLNSLISVTFNHSIEICDYDDNCVGSKPTASDIITGYYILSGNNQYEPKVVRLYLWRE